jgi:lysylphosphatidylglycerol synthase-like protein
VPLSSRYRWLALLPLAIGIALFVVTLRYVDVHDAFRAVARLGPAAPIVVITSGLWHLCRTIAWAQAFGATGVGRLTRLFRVRLAADAFSFLTVSGVGGEPLKVLLVRDTARPRDAAAAIVLERAAYFVVTLGLMTIGALVALRTLTLAALWVTVFKTIAVCSAALAFGAGVAVIRGAAWLKRLVPDGTVIRFLEQITIPVDQDRRRLARIVLCECGCFGCHTVEAWVVMRALGASVTLEGAVAMEVFARGVNLASAFVPANIGTLEAASVAIAIAVGASPTVGAALAIVRRARVLAWAGVGLLLYPWRARWWIASARPDTAPPSPSHPPAPAPQA